MIDTRLLIIQSRLQSDRSDLGLGRKPSTVKIAVLSDTIVPRIDEIDLRFHKRPSTFQGTLLSDKIEREIVTIDLRIDTRPSPIEIKLLSEQLIIRSSDHLTSCRISMSDRSNAWTRFQGIARPLRTGDARQRSLVQGSTSAQDRRFPRKATVTRGIGSTPSESESGSEIEIAGIVIIAPTAEIYDLHIEEARLNRQRTSRHLRR